MNFSMLNIMDVENICKCLIQKNAIYVTLLYDEKYVYNYNKTRPETFIDNILSARYIDIDTDDTNARNSRLEYIQLHKDDIIRNLSLLTNSKK